jgi:hypothetical protein
MSLRRASLTENLRKGEFKLKTQPMGTNWQRAPTCALRSETMASWLKKKGTQMCKLSINHAPFVLIRSRTKLFLVKCIITRTFFKSVVTGFYYLHDEQLFSLKGNNSPLDLPQFLLTRSKVSGHMKRTQETAPKTSIFFAELWFLKVGHLNMVSKTQI